MTHDIFSEQFIASVQELYDEWKSDNPGSTLPDFEAAIERAKSEGILPESQWYKAP